MSHKSGLMISLFAAGLSAVSVAQEAPRRQLTARELFYSAASSPAPAKPQSQQVPPKAPAKRAPAQTAQVTPPAPRSQSTNPNSTPPAQSSAPIVMTADPPVDARPSSAPAPVTGPALG